MNILILGPVLWDSIWGHGQELTRILSNKHEITYLEPIVHSSDLSLSFQRTTTNPVPETVIIIKRETRLGLNIIYGIYCELNNLYHLIRLDYDIFITYCTTCAFLATICSRLCGKKVFSMYVDDLAELYKPKIAKFLTKYIFTPLVLKFSNFTVTTAHKLEEYAKKYNSQVTCVPNGVDLNYFKETKKSIAKKSIENEKFVIGFVGSFGNHINYKILLKTAKNFRNDKTIEFLFAGGGEGLEYFKNKINELNLNNIKFMGVVPHSEVPRIINEMDVCIIPFNINSLTDSICPVKLFEYWAMGKPVISTSLYEMKKIAMNKVIFADNPQELSNVIIELRNDKNLRKKYAEIGIQEVKKYDWDVLGEKYLKIIETLQRS